MLSRLALSMEPGVKMMLLPLMAVAFTSSALSLPSELRVRRRLPRSPSRMMVPSCRASEA